MRNIGKFLVLVVLVFSVGCSAENPQQAANAKKGSLGEAKKDIDSSLPEVLHYTAISNYWDYPKTADKVLPSKTPAIDPTGFNSFLKEDQEGEVFSPRESSFAILTKSIPLGFTEERFFAKIEASGTCSWQIASGYLPEGIIFDSDRGVFFGSTKEPFLAILTIKAISKNDFERTQEFKFAILDRSIKEILNNLKDKTRNLELLETELKDAYVGKHYAQQILFCGGTPPYSWKVCFGKLPRGLVIDDEYGFIYGTPYENGIFEFRVKVSDCLDRAEEREFTIIAEGGPLYITSGTLKEALAGERYIARIEAEGGKPPYEWSLFSGGLPDGLEFSAKNAFIYGIPLEEGRFKFKVKVLDSEGDSDIAELKFEVKKEKFEIITESLIEGEVGVEYYELLLARGENPPYKWNIKEGKLPRGIVLDECSGVLSGLPQEGYNAEILIEVQDSVGKTKEKNLTFTVKESELSILCRDIFVWTVGEDIYERIFAKGGNPPYQWSIQRGTLPSDLSFFSDGVGAGIEGLLSEAGDFSFIIQLKDSKNNICEKKVSMNIKGSELQIITDELDAVQLDCYFSQTFKAKGDSPPYYWNIASGNLPSNVALKADTGILSGVPSEEGSFDFEVILSNNHGNSCQKSFSLQAYDLLEIITEELAPGYRGDYYSQYLEVEGGTPPYRWVLSGGELPQGLVLSSNGEISGIPEKGCTSSIQIAVYDSKDSSVSSWFDIEISGGALEIITDTLPKGVVGVEYSQSLQAEGGAEPYYWIVQEGGLPEGFQLNNTEGVIWGTATEPSSNDFTIRVADQDGGSSYKGFSLEIEEDARPLEIITGTRLPNGKVGQAYEVQIEAQGGAIPYQWFCQALPTGLSINSASGVISGIPEEKAEDQALPVKVKDSNNQETSKQFLLSIFEELEYASPTDLVAYGSDAKVGLAWHNPDAHGYVETKILRKTTSFPRDINDGYLVYSGEVDNCVDRNLTNRTTYYYSAFAVYEDGGVSEFCESAKAQAKPQEVTLNGNNDPYADQVVEFSPLAPGGFGSNNMPNVVLGYPRGYGENMGSFDVVSLHARINDDDGETPPYGGSIILEFSDNLVINESGPDFTIFENVFFIGGNAERRFMEPAVVAVSQDGFHFYEFPFDFVPHEDENGQVDVYNVYCYNFGFAGKNCVYSNNLDPDPTDPSVSGGDSFDLSDITAKDLSWIRYVKIIACGDEWLTDINGDKVHHPIETGACSGEGSSGFDLDAVSAVHY